MVENQTEIALQAVSRMQKYIQINYASQISMASLAKESMFSPWYSYRLFLKWTGYTPFDYLRRIRLSCSAMKLRDEDVKIADVAFEMGFGSVDGYQRAFLREFGVNPREYSKAPVPICLFTAYDVKLQNERGKIRKMEKVKYVFAQVIERPKRKAIIKRGEKAGNYFEYCDEVGCDVWGMLKSIKGITGEPVGMWLPLSLRNGKSEYVQGVEVSEEYEGEVPQGYEMIDLPKANYLMFRGEPFLEEDYCVAIEEIWEAVKKYDPSFLNMVWDKEAVRIQYEPIGERGYIELVGVKKGI